MSSWKFILLLALFGASFFNWGCSARDKGNFDLVWSDEFDYEGLPDETKWNYDTVGNSYGWGNNELQYYTVRDKKNAWVDGEYLHISAVREKLDDFNYTSARLTTKEKGDWLYGRMEIRHKCLVAAESGLLSGCFLQIGSMEGGPKVERLILWSM